MYPEININWMRFARQNMAQNIQSTYGKQAHRVTAPKTMIVSAKGKK